jgi:hypothetical protein
MGIVICSKCESTTGIALVCRHVAIAVANGDIRIDVSDLEYGDADDQDLGFIYGITFCQACIDRLALPASGAYLARAVADEVCGDLQGICGGCLARWRERRRNSCCT